MLFSYLKIAWKVLLRRKFFTAISLFGISFTLMILLVVYAMYDFTVGPQMPEKRVDRLLYANTMYIWGPNVENQSGPSYSFLERYIRPLRTPEKVSISTGAGGTTVAYVGNQKLKLDQKYTDAEFWQILDFDFVEGRPYSAGEVRDAAHVAVINETTARRYFGRARGVLGRVLVTDEIRYQVVGVVRDVPATRLTYADVWMPITTSTQDIHNAEYMGSCMAIILARTPADLPAVQQEFAQAVARAPLPTDVYKWCKEVRVYAGSLLATHVRGFYGEDGPDPGVARFVRLVTGLGLLFMLLPALSLININISRIRERSSEIGVRKAFGATSGALVRQFLVENIFLTLLGGVLGLGLAAGALHLLNTSGLIAYTDFGLNGRVFAGAVGAVLLFGILSGVYPAYKMSKLQAIKALKGESTPA